MSASLYDKVVTEKIKGWLVDPNLTVLDPDETARLFQKTADITNDAPLRLPLIAISRDRDIDLPATNKQPLSYMGKSFNSINGTVDHLNAIRINLGYQIDIYTKFKVEADEYVRNFVFNLVNHPAMAIEIPYNGSNLEYVSYLRLQSPISDNSDIPERLMPGQFTRMTLKFRLNDAYLFSYNYKVIPKITAIEIGYDTKFLVDLDLQTQFNIEQQMRIKQQELNKGKKSSLSIKIVEEE